MDFNEFKFGVFEAWVKAMLDDDWLFVGHVIPHTKRVRGRGSSRQDDGIVASGCALTYRDNARYDGKHVLVGGFCRELREFYTFTYCNRLPISPLVEANPPWFEAFMNNRHIWPLECHPQFDLAPMLDLMQACRSGNLTTSQMQLGDFVSALNTKKIFGEDTTGYVGEPAWWYESFLRDIWFQKSFSECRGGLHADNKPSAEIDDEAFFIRWIKSMTPEETERLRSLPLGFPPGFEFVSTALDVVEASDILF